MTASGAIKSPPSGLLRQYSTTSAAARKAASSGVNPIRSPFGPWPCPSETSAMYPAPRRRTMMTLRTLQLVVRTSHDTMPRVPQGYMHFVGKDHGHLVNLAPGTSLHIGHEITGSQSTGFLVRHDYNLPSVRRSHHATTPRPVALASWHGWLQRFKKFFNPNATTTPVTVEAIRSTVFMACKSKVKACGLIRSIPVSIRFYSAFPGFNAIWRRYQVPRKPLFPSYTETTCCHTQTLQGSMIAPPGPQPRGPEQRSVLVYLSVNTPDETMNRMVEMQPHKIIVCTPTAYPTHPPRLNIRNGVPWLQPFRFLHCHDSPLSQPFNVEYSRVQRVLSAEFAHPKRGLAKIHVNPTCERRRPCATLARAVIYRTARIRTLTLMPLRSLPVMLCHSRPSFLPRLWWPGSPRRDCRNLHPLKAKESCQVGRN